MSPKRVVVTGLGAVSPVGNTVADTWDAISRGKSGVDIIESVNQPEYSVRIAADVKDFDASNLVDPKEGRRMDDFTLYGMAAGAEAVESCALHEAGYDRNRIGIIMGSGIGGISTIELGCRVLMTKGPRRVSPFFIPSSIINMIGGHLSIRYNFCGANLALATACTTSTHAIGLAARLIRWGDVDAMLAGGSEAPLTPVAITAFSSMKALSSRNNAPTEASRPWDRDRDGFVLGAGSGALVLESYEGAKARGAKIFAEVVGFGMSGDAHHITSPIPDGSGFLASMKAALADAQLNPEDVDYINAHGTSTVQGDIAETMAIKRLFGNNTKIPISSTKSMIGHLLGAAGGVEAVVTILAMQKNLLPPTINLNDPDDQCDLDYIPNKSREAKANIAISNSFGFGGTNGTLVFRK